VDDFSSNVEESEEVYDSEDVASGISGVK